MLSNCESWKGSDYRWVQCGCRVFAAEYDRLVTLLFSTTIFGWSVGEDLYVVPEHGRHLLQTDHHGVIHMSFRTEESLNHCIVEMDRRGFPLPDEVPDSTFKQPRWMKNSEG